MNTYNVSFTVHSNRCLAQLKTVTDTSLKTGRLINPLLLLADEQLGLVEKGHPYRYRYINYLQF